MDPGYAPTYRSLGQLHEINGRLAEAIQWYRKALQRDPGSGEYMKSVASRYLMLGDFESIAGIREKMHEHLDATDWRLPWLDGTITLTQGTWVGWTGARDGLTPACQQRGGAHAW